MLPGLITIFYFFVFKIYLQLQIVYLNKLAFLIVDEKIKKD